MERICSYPDGHWRMRVDIPFCMGVRQGELFALCGQADLKGEGEVGHPGDLKRQTAAAIGHIAKIVTDLGCDPEDVTRLVVYYMDDGSISRKEYEEHIARTIGHTVLPTITLVPLDSFFYPGLMVEIDAYGVAGAGQHSSKRIPGNDSPFSQAIRCGRFTFVGGVLPANEHGTIQSDGDIVGQSNIVLDRLDEILSRLEAHRNDIVKINNWYVGGGSAEDWGTSARIRARYYPEPGPVATGIPLSRLNPASALIQTDCWIMQDENGKSLAKEHYWPDDHWDWPIHLPFKHGLLCDGVLFVGGQVSMDAAAKVVDPGNVPAQTRTSMDNIGKVLDGFDSRMDDIFKLNTFYRGRGEPDSLHENLTIRTGYFHQQGTASTGIPFHTLAYPGLEIEIEAIALYRD